VATVSGDVTLRLMGVSEEPVVNGVRQFALILHGPPEIVLPQGTYALTHTQLGSLAWFMVPVVGSNAERVIYQVCFSTFE
jgi:hypothetical protein